jgi:subtilase family serine protease
MWPQRQVLTVTGTLGQFKRAFNTDFGVFTYGKTTVVAPIQTPHTSKALPIASVQHLVGYNPAHTYNIRGGYANFVGYSPQIIASGFDFSGAFAAGYNGTGINVAVNGTGPIAPADAALFATAFNDTVAPITQINASPQPASPTNGHTGTGAVDPYPAGLAVAPPVTAPCTLPNFPTPPNYNKCNPEDIEAQLDTQSQIGLAPGANVLFYLAYNPSICVSPTTGQFVENNKNGSCPSGSEAYPLIGIQLADDSLQQTIADNLADTISLSWGEAENEALFDDYISANPSTPGVGQIEFASLAAEGIAVFVSSGDNGAWECFNPETGQPLGVACVSYPASDPNVDAVGGVNAPFLENGRLNGQITAWSDNTTYGGNGQFYNNVGSGGGISTVFAPPPWQQSAIKGITHREVPDSSLLADPDTGVAIVIYAGFKGDTAIFPEGGTSASAPESAAMWGDVLSACKKFASCATSSGSKPYRLGNAAPYFYSVYEGKGNLAYTQSVYDVVYGDNQAVPAPTPTPVGNATPAPFPTPVGYKAGKGYDMVTGVGVPFVGHFIDSLIKGAGAQ